MNTPGPKWTRARLARVMTLTFGDAASGRLETGAAAAAMGVGRRSVQRWLHAPHGRSRAAIPPARLEQLVAAITPSEASLAAERSAQRYAARAVAGLDLARGQGVLESWEKQRWLEEHFVLVLAVRVGRFEVRQLAVTRAELGKVDAVARRGRIIDQAVVATRFHATVLASKVLTDVGPWRYRATLTQVHQGGTWTWLPDAPVTHLGRDRDEMDEGSQRRDQRW